MAENVSDRDRFTLINVRSDGEVDLTDGNIGGDLLCSGSTFENPGAVALRADGLKVGGNVFLRGWVDNQGKVTPFTAEGEVRLLAADIKVTIDLSGGTFKNPGAIALSADGLKVDGAMFLNGAVDNQGKITPFNADGEVSLKGADIGNILDCEGGTFSNPGKMALNAAGVKVGGSVFFRDLADPQGKITPFNAEGEVNLVGAAIGGNLDCGGATLKNPDATALNAERLKAGDNLFLRSWTDNQGKVIPFSAEGAVELPFAEIKGGIEVLPSSSRGSSLDLEEARTGVFYDDENSWPQTDNLSLDGFEYSHFADASTKDADKRIDWVRRQRQGASNFATQPYEQLAKVLREDGDDEGARRVLIAMENDRRWNGTTGSSGHLWSWVLWATIGYGYDTWRALWFIAALVVIGWALFLWGHRREWIISIEDHPEHFRPFNPFIYSLETLLPLVDLYQSKHWVPDANTTGGKTLRGYLWVHTLLGWFFASMLIAGVTGLVQK